MGVFLCAWVFTNKKYEPQAQRPDGGFQPFWAEAYSGLDATCYQLTQMEQLGLLSTPLFRRAIEFFVSRQHDSGYWEEDQSQADFAPPWIQPGDMAGQIYLTANCGFWVALASKSGTGFEASSESSLERGVHFLQENLEGKWDKQYPHTVWLVCGLALLTQQEAWVKLGVSDLYAKLSSLTPNQLTWMGITLRNAGLADETPLLKQTRARLIDRSTCL